MQIKDKALFLKYAFPCSSTLVNRRWLKKEKAEKMLSDLKAGVVKENLNDIYLVATSECKLMALQSGKREIDGKIIRAYFQDRHDEVVDRRSREMGDFDADACRTYPGKVVKSGEGITLLTPKGKRVFNNSFVNGLKEGDYVITHFDYIVEKITPGRAKDLWDKKKSYVKNFKSFE